MAVRAHALGKPAPSAGFGQTPLGVVPRRCPRCGRSSYGRRTRFCVFDGERLLEAELEGPDYSLIGRVVDERYEVVELIAQGAMAEVHRVRHRVLGRSFALKALRPELCHDAELCTRFLREARALASLSHPNIVRVSDSGTLPTGQPYFVMEYLEGMALDAVIRQEAPLEVGFVLEIAAAVSEALLAAHRRGIIHRDLKPDNIQIVRGRRGLTVKVLDFGLARVLGQSRLTRPDMVCGSPEYMSPEQATGRDVGVASDIYSLGVVMYEMLTGRLPFEADSYVALVYQHVYAPPLPLMRVLPMLSDLRPLESLVMRCLEKSPTRRFGSMEQFAHLLAALRVPSQELPIHGVSRPIILASAQAGSSGGGAASLEHSLDLRVVARWLVLGWLVGVAILACAWALRAWL